MAVSRQRKNLSYGIGSPLLDLSPLPIVSTRAPTTSDSAEIGTIWSNTSTNGVWILASVVANVATWTDANVSGGATITTGDLTVVAGDINVTAGDIDLTAGDIILDLGAVLVTAGNITATGGDIIATNGDIVCSFGGITVDVGNILVTTGDVTTTAGDFIADAGDVTVTLGDITVSAGHITAGLGNIEAGLDMLCRSMFVDGDEGTGTAGQTGITNIVDTTLSTGAGVVLMKTANPGDSSGWMKIYVGTDIRYIPFWTNLSP